jgi:hypothetical protein
VKRFINAFFSRFNEFLQPGRHPKWREVNLAADVPGWERIKPAQEWLGRIAAEKAQSDQLQDLEAFLSSRGTSASPEQRERLFEEFLAWQSAREKGTQRAKWQN